MDEYQLGSVDPPLNDTETLLYHLICNLSTAQVHHRFHDPTAPPHPDISGLDDFEEMEKLIEEWRQARMEHLKAKGAVQPHDPLPLSDLWLAIEPPEGFAPTRVQGDDLYFDNFVISQRLVPNESRSPEGSWPRHYSVAIPTGNPTFRCIAREYSGRMFCTEELHHACQVPPKDEFSLVRVRGIGVNFETGERRSTVMHLYLPATYGRWRLIQHEEHESIVHDEE